MVEQPFAHSVVSALLRPLVKTALKCGIKLPQLLAMVKDCYVFVAQADLRKSASSVSESKINLMTGVHRKDVKRILNSDVDGESKQPKGDLITRVIGLWTQHEDFCTRPGKPDTLSCTGNESEFFRLVKRASEDLNPYTVMFEMERTGVVAKTSRGVKLLRRFQFIESDVERGMTILAKDVEDLHSVVEFNLGLESERRGEKVFKSEDDRHLHLRTEYDNIPVSCIPEIRKWLLKEGSSFHQRARNFLAPLDRDISGVELGEQGRVRVSLGSFGKAIVTDEVKDES